MASLRGSVCRDGFGLWIDDVKTLHAAREHYPKRHLPRFVRRISCAPYYTTGAPQRALLLPIPLRATSPLLFALLRCGGVRATAIYIICLLCACRATTCKTKLAARWHARLFATPLRADGTGLVAGGTGGMTSTDGRTGRRRDSRTPAPSRALPCRSMLLLSPTSPYAAFVLLTFYCIFLTHTAHHDTAETARQHFPPWQHTPLPCCHIYVFCHFAFVCTRRHLHFSRFFLWWWWIYISSLAFVPV